MELEDSDKDGFLSFEEYKGDDDFWEFVLFCLVNNLIEDTEGLDLLMY